MILGSSPRVECRPYLKKIILTFFRLLPFTHICTLRCVRWLACLCVRVFALCVCVRPLTAHVTSVSLAFSSPGLCTCHFFCLEYPFPSPPSPLPGVLLPLHCPPPPMSGQEPCWRSHNPHPGLSSPPALVTWGCNLWFLCPSMSSSSAGLGPESAC